MAYTIKQLAQISGVSTRTLRFYDETGLLKPAFYGDNQYRYYEEEQLLLLQQILFYRELDFSLQDIQTVLGRDTFDKISSLQSHKSMLHEKLHRITEMLKTIDKTILHLRGEVSMQVEEFFDPIRLRNSSIQKEYEKYLVSKGILTQEEMNSSWEKLNQWTQDDWDNFKGNGDTFYRKMAEAIDNGLEPGNENVQNLVHQHYLIIQPLWSFNQSSYIKLADAYIEDQNFKKFCEIYHHKLLSFLVEAMKHYAKHQLR